MENSAAATSKAGALPAKAFAGRSLGTRNYAVQLLSLKRQSMATAIRPATLIKRQGSYGTGIPTMSGGEVLTGGGSRANDHSPYGKTVVSKRADVAPFNAVGCRLGGGLLLLPDLSDSVGHLVRS